MRWACCRRKRRRKAGPGAHPGKNLCIEGKRAEPVRLLRIVGEWKIRGPDHDRASVEPTHLRKIRLPRESAAHDRRLSDRRPPDRPAGAQDPGPGLTDRWTSDLN